MNTLKRQAIPVLLSLCLFLTVIVGFFPKMVHATTYEQEVESEGDCGDAWGISASYATARVNGTGGSTTGYPDIGQWIPGGYQVGRSFLKWNTSSIPAGATISSANVQLYGYSDGSNDDFIIRLQKWTGTTPIEGASVTYTLKQTNNGAVGGSNALKTEHPSSNASWSSSAECVTSNPANYTLAKIEFAVRRYANPTSTMVARVYAVSGTSGVDGVPTGSSLADSSGVPAGDIISGSWGYQNFTFMVYDGYEMGSGVEYALAIEASTTDIDGSNYISTGHIVAKNGSSNKAGYSNSAWANRSNTWIYRTFGGVLNQNDFIEYDGINYDDGNFNTSAWTTSGYNTITISNFSLITKDGFTHVCVRSDEDVQSSTPTDSERVRSMRYADGAGKRAKLVVVYTTNVAPTLGEWSVTGGVGGTLYAWQSFGINLTVDDGNDKDDILNVTVGFMSGNYSWDEDVGSWSEVTANSRINFVSGSCANSTKNTSAYFVYFAFQIYWNGSDGNVDAWAKVFDSADESGTSTYSTLFVFESDTILHSDAVVNDGEVNPGDTLYFTGTVYYEGTSTIPYSDTDLTVHAELLGVSKGNDGSLTTGQYNISVTAETSVGSHSYTLYVLNDETSVTNQTVGVTVYSLTIGNLQSIEFLGGGQYSYQAQVNYTSGSAINGAYANISLPSDSVISQLTSNSTGWVSFVLTQSNGSESGTYNLYGVNDNSYGITYMGANVTFQLLNWTLDTQDVDGNELSATTITITKGSSTVYASGDDVLRVPDDTYNISVSWKGITVNSTSNVAVSTVLSTDFNCTAYPYTYESTRFWVASNSTISSVTWSSNLLSVEFSGAVATYTLRASCTTKPSSIHNVTYDYASAWSSDLTLTHYGNTTIQVRYANWGGTYIQSTDQRITSASWDGIKLTIVTTGSTGETGELVFYCGSRSEPESTTGFATVSYSSSTKLLTGNYVFSSDKTLEMLWTASEPGTVTGGGDTYMPSNLLVQFAIVVQSVIEAGNSVDGVIELDWQGTNVLYVYEVNFGGNETWIQLEERLPVKFRLPVGNKEGKADLHLQVVIPDSVAPGEYMIPCEVKVMDQNQQSITLASSLMFEVFGATYNVPEYMTLVFLGIIGLIVVGMVLRKQH